MTSADVIRHSKILGKLAFAYDAATTDTTNQQLYLSRLMDQVSKDGTVFNIPGALIVAQFAAQWNSNIVNGPATLQTTIKNLTAAYLTGPDFVSSLATPPSGGTAHNVVDALVTDQAIVTTWYYTGGGLIIGLLNLFNPTVAIATTGTTEYSDATYAISAIS